MSKKNTVTVFTDGSCSGNGKKNASGGIGIHFPNGELKDLSKVYQGDFCTNQKTELLAILTAIRYIKKYYNLDKIKIVVKTDSMYSINCVTKWITGWMNNGWVTANQKPVSNREYIEHIYYYYNKYNIEFEHVEAHTDMDDDDSVANAVADKLATKATQKSIEQKKSVNRSTGSNRSNSSNRSNKSASQSKYTNRSTKSGSKTSLKKNVNFNDSRSNRYRSKHKNSETDCSPMSYKKNISEPIHKHYSLYKPKNQDSFLKSGNFFVELVKK